MVRVGDSVSLRLCSRLPGLQRKLTGKAWLGDLLAELRRLTVAPAVGTARLLERRRLLQLREKLNLRSVVVGHRAEAHLVLELGAWHGHGLADVVEVTAIVLFRLIHHSMSGSLQHVVWLKCLSIVRIRLHLLLLRFPLGHAHGRSASHRLRWLILQAALGNCLVQHVNFGLRMLLLILSKSLL